MPRARRGQAEPISVMILVAATLVVAIGLYAYFTGVYAGQSQRISLVDAIANVASGVSMFEEAALINRVQATGDYTYCYVVSIANSLGNPIAVYITLLPGAPEPNGIINVNDLYLYVPVYYLGTAPYERRVHVWLVEDYDRDGVVEVLGQDPTTGALQVAYNTTPSCSELYENKDNLANLKPLLLPRDADDPNYGYNGSKVYLSIEGLSYTEYVRAMVPGAPANLYVPLWNITLPANGKVSILVFAWNDSPLDAASLVGFVRYGDSFYAATTLQLSTVKTAP